MEMAGVLVAIKMTVSPVTDRTFGLASCAFVCCAFSYGRALLWAGFSDVIAIPLDPLFSARRGIAERPTPRDEGSLLSPENAVLFTSFCLALLWVRAIALERFTD